MGGNNLKDKGVKLRDLDTETFETIGFDISTALTKKGFNTNPLPAIRDKKRHGDVDLLTAIEGNDFANLVGFVIDMYKPSRIQVDHEAKTFSFNYRSAQVDIRGVPTTDFNFAYHYFAYNDVGNLIGRIARSCGLKFGFDGLFYKQYGVNKQTRRDILITKEIDVALYVLGFDILAVNVIKAPGALRPPTRDQLFKAIVSSELFTHAAYSAEAQKAKDKARDYDRPTFVAFLKYIGKIRGFMPVIDIKKSAFNNALAIGDGFKDRLEDARKEDEEIATLAKCRKLITKFGQEQGLKTTNLGEWTRSCLNLVVTQLTHTQRESFVNGRDDGELMRGYYILFVLG